MTSLKTTLHEHLTTAIRERDTVRSATLRLALTAVTNAELAGLVAQAIAQTGATGMAQLGAVMKAVQPLVAGRAEGARVAGAVRAALS